MQFTALQISNPTQAVIEQFEIPAQHHDLMNRWGEMISAKFEGANIDVRAGQTIAHPFAQELIAAFGLHAFKVRDAMLAYHRASFEAKLIRRGVS